MRIWLGMSYLAWALLAWAMIVCTLLMIVIYRVLISHRKEDEQFMKPDEIRRDREHVRHTDRMLRAFAIATAVTLAGILAARAAGLL